VIFPASLSTQKLNALHPHVRDNAPAWEEIELLYRDGNALRAQASKFISRRPKEPQSVYSSRLARFTSRPILGAALGWYQSAIYQNNPNIRVLRNGATVQGDTEYSDFLKNCDGAGSEFFDFNAGTFQSLLLYGSAWVLTDRVVTDGEYPSLAAQKAAGALDAHLVRYEPGQVINWECDALGNLAWVVIKAERCERAFPGDAKVFDQWFYFDREQCALYEAEKGATGEFAWLVQGYPRPHTLSAAGRVPVRRIALPEGLWLGNRAHLSARTHLDLVNSLDWAIFVGCHPTLWMKGQYRDDPTRSEVGWLQIPEGGDIGYLEPSGNTYELAMKQVEEVREDLYRQVYLQSQGRSTKATPMVQSGYSKEIDLKPSMDVLNGIADVFRAGLLGVLTDVAAARGDDAEFTINNLEFDGDDTAETDRDIQFIHGIYLGDTAEREIKKKVASRALKGLPDEVIQAVMREIETMKTDQQRAQDQMQQRVSRAFAVS
jgi:hypothetical protein